ncbi:DeoR/GlpR family DNA-binding transcription regulator [Gordonia liuliyuniae]|uniref:Lactose phosphotransferase system repressor n=1 Tax=Gordonia liuliyuniae TaxID=2911517 RepID=A0ABS9IRE3_9ACTN|nr:DeoR/GlpR family DNA-binding transcription regulator [Gordonia liuliyuniae]MCF8588123.1 DeoR/GlpR family DNA-binding transcription regulator [Gordonia liuliyuniae]
MYAEERQQAIAVEVGERGRVSVADLSERFSVTGETVRRDLAALQRAGSLIRVHGGAVRLDVAAVVDEPDLAEREAARRTQKAAIGAAAQQFLPAAGGAVLFDAGTTTFAAATAIGADARHQFVTNSLPIAATLTALPRSNVIFVGGRLRPKTQASVGADACDLLAGLHTSVGFIGTNGLTLTDGLSTPDIDEAAVKRAMIAACDRVVVLADSSKINRQELVTFGAVADIDVLVTDDGVDPGLASVLSSHDIEVVIA